LWIVLTSICVVLSTFAIKGQAFTVDDLVKSRKENVGFSVALSKQQPLNLIGDNTGFCSPYVSGFSPQSDQELSSLGGTFKGNITWSAYANWNVCGFGGPIIATKVTAGCYTNSAGQLELCQQLPGAEEATFSLAPNNSLFDRSVSFAIGGKPMLIKQSGQYTDFSLRDWIRFKVIESALGKECARDRSKCPTSPPRKYYTTTTNGGIRG
jgi:hypothetical protein